MSSSSGSVVGRLVLAIVLGGVPLIGSRADEFDRAPIRYSDSTPTNVVSRLQDRLASGKARLEHEAHFGYLRSVLRELDVPVSSQMLVFSKTSLQRHRICPSTPRALYFNDDVYIGFCQAGDVVEVSASDPKLGTVFYTLDQSEEEKPRFVRQGDNCLICHGGSQTQGVPGHVVRSVFADPTGQPILASGTYRIDHTSPLERRWGGWYVTGTHGKETHLGNLIIRARRVEEPVDNSAGLNVTDLSSRLAVRNYLSPHSDIVALMVLEHQAEGHNLITRANFQARQALHMEAALNRELKLPAANRWDSTTSRIRAACEPLVKYLLFADEAKLTAKLAGTSGFAEEFVKKGPRDAKGRSLRDFDLEKRLFKYPCSYLVYTEAFTSLPPAVKEYVYRRMAEVLDGRDTSGAFAHLSAADRTNIREILEATKPDFPRGQ